MAFKAAPVHFSLKDVGSEIIDQLSADVYTGPASIMRELVKNAYDAFIPLDADVFEDAETDRQIVISRERETSKLGRLLINDNGLGQDLTDLKANVQISISRKQQELENATGFRGLGSWAILGGGSKVVIASSKYGVSSEFRLTINVREIYRILSPTTTLDDILNNKSCVSFGVSPKAKDDHFTTVEIICDGPPSMVNGHELNRLFPFTDPNETELKNLLMRSCPLPYADDGKLFKEIRAIYDDVGYVPTPVLLDGTRLERRLPSSAGEFARREINMGKSKLAIAWFVEDPTNSGELTRFIRDHEHLLAGPGLQLAKLNVPIGPKNMFGDNVRATILNWYIGEVHIIAKDVLPNASGDSLRAGTAGESFVEALKGFYKSLEERAEQKSTRVSLIRKMKQGEEAAKKLERGNLSAGQEQEVLAKVAKAVATIEETGKKTKPSTVVEQRVRTASKLSAVKEARQEVRRALKEAGYIDRFGSQLASKKSGSKKVRLLKKAKNSKSSLNGTVHGLSTSEFQAAVGEVVPRLKGIGLTAAQIEEVLNIIRELVTN